MLSRGKEWNRITSPRESSYSMPASFPGGRKGLLQASDKSRNLTLWSPFAILLLILLVLISAAFSDPSNGPLPVPFLSCCKVLSRAGLSPPDWLASNWLWAAQCRQCIQTTTLFCKCHPWIECDVSHRRLSGPAQLSCDRDVGRFSDINSADRQLKPGVKLEREKRRGGEECSQLMLISVRSQLRFVKR